MGVSDVRGYDIPEIDISEREFPKDKFFPADLSVPLPFDRSFDIAISTEVAEHIHPTGAIQFINNLCNLSEVVGFALPYQGGRGHVNENWVEYWAKIFGLQGFDCYDALGFPFGMRLQFAPIIARI